MLAGAIMLIEMGVVALKPNEAGTTTLMGYAVDRATAPPWIFALALALGGLVLFRVTAPRARVAFQDATSAVGESRKAA